MIPPSLVGEVGVGVVGVGVGLLERVELPEEEVARVALEGGEGGNV